METYDPESSFSDLPQAMVEEMLSDYKGLSSKVSDDITNLQKDKDKFRDELKGRMRHESDVIKVQSFPTTAGTDGSNCYDKLLATDFVAIAAVAVEGLTPPKMMEPIWKKPRHFVKVESLPHDENTAVLSQAIMFSMEMQLAALAPHNVIFIDGSLLTLSISYNIALNKKSPEKLIDFLINGDKKEYSDDRAKFQGIKHTLECYKEILAAKRTDRMVVAAPKYTVKNDVCKSIGKEGFDDRGFLSVILKPGEFIEPFEFERDHPGKFLIASLHDELKSVADDIEKLLREIHVTYYKPKEHFPAIRLEMSSAVAKNKERLAMLFDAVKLQTGYPGIMEPYPTYLADRMVKHLSKALPVIKGISMNQMVEKWEGSTSDINVSMHSYRTGGFR
ncbi:DNA double-strand break repair nuclease NurA [Candidatus Nitrosotenuis chungbukensis]|uniref:DNA double-strand break repair nuclease NurA n=1 Tax=Candidatus Nitrosotenuis chungbukensis TaxID=1353246 RepID=UPI0005B295CC|nr:DNA double-strand break repair nuclease NurA [Candidatus Nitrosotenuis chungbukensis]WKT57929.1 DNA double-strand break repair nuclease NurA [Candidatus Nitrosotenuis chungbukensis]